MFAKIDEGARQKLAEVIKIGRMRKNISQEYLAELADISRNYVSNIERKNANPTLSVLIKIAKTIDLDLNEIIKG